MRVYHTRLHEHSGIYEPVLGPRYTRGDLKKRAGCLPVLSTGYDGGGNTVLRGYIVIRTKIWRANTGEYVVVWAHRWFVLSTLPPPG